MFQWIRNFPSQISALVRRNKYRIIIGFSVVGGVWYYYGRTIRDAYEIYRLLMQQPSVESAEEAQENGCSPAEEVAFQQTIATSDETSQKQFYAIRVQLADLYSHDLERIQAELKNPPSNEQQSEEKKKREILFVKLNQHVFARLLTSVLSSVLLLLLARVEVCLIGRANRRPVDDATRAEHKELLSALRNASSQQVMSRIDRCSRETVSLKFEQYGLVPTASVNIELIISSVQQIAQDFISSLNGYTWLLGRLETEGDQSESCKETLDVLESPQFDAVVRFLTKHFVANAIQRSTSTTTSSSFPMALVIPGIKSEPEVVTAQNGIYVAHFQQDLAVNELCRAVYFASSDSSSVDPQDAALLKNLSNDENMAKLGDLLEKLVRADMSK